jgi:hypothetical protein
VKLGSLIVVEEYPLFTRQLAVDLAIILASKLFNADALPELYSCAVAVKSDGIKSELIDVEGLFALAGITETQTDSATTNGTKPHLDPRRNWKFGAVILVSRKIAVTP